MLTQQDWCFLHTMSRWDWNWEERWYIEREDLKEYIEMFYLRKVACSKWKIGLVYFFSSQKPWDCKALLNNSSHVGYFVKVSPSATDLRIVPVPNWMRKHLEKMQNQGERGLKNEKFSLRLLALKRYSGFKWGPDQGDCPCWRDLSSRIGWEL